ncbi:hypothetical protein SAT01_25810 [Sinomonas atrocyanea]|nr:hypothetical protein SAT01_25810 [Sinomonas atrocyanea]GGG58782.1 hypothetical protein GCM10007172_07040 [Sinomonas atrocyanea]
MAPSVAREAAVGDDEERHLPKGAQRVYSVAMTEQRDTGEEPAEDEVEYPSRQEADGPRDSGDDANALRFTEEEQLIHEQIRRHREEAERKKKAAGQG